MSPTGSISPSCTDCTVWSLGHRRVMILCTIFIVVAQALIPNSPDQFDVQSTTDGLSAHASVALKTALLDKEKGIGKESAPDICHTRHGSQREIDEEHVGRYERGDERTFLQLSFLRWRVSSSRGMDRGHVFFGSWAGGE
ncbi:hypothetical protein BDR04DRAFT_1093381 [Suillus decipiens]|nr:hypothetical protein BDR04DRAFT_1093381 [Suillus decipiens]